MSNKAPKQPRFRHLWRDLYFCLSTYGGMGFGMGYETVYYDRVFPFVYKRRTYAQMTGYMASLRSRYGK